MQRHLHWVVERNEPMALNLDDSSAGCVCHIVGLRVVHWHTEYTKGESDVHYHFHHAIGRQRCYWVTKKEQEFVNRIVRRRCWPRRAT